MLAVFPARSCWLALAVLAVCMAGIGFGRGDAGVQVTIAGVPGVRASLIADLAVAVWAGLNALYTGRNRSPSTYHPGGTDR